jgi:hypothetical protein
MPSSPQVPARRSAGRAYGRRPERLSHEGAALALQSTEVARRGLREIGGVLQSSSAFPQPHDL